MLASTFTIEQVAIERLHVNPKNARRIGDIERERLMRSLAEFGCPQPLIVPSDSVSTWADVALGPPPPNWTADVTSINRLPGSVPLKVYIPHVKGPVIGWL